MKKYNGYEDIPVYNFYKVNETNNFRWLYKKYKGGKLEYEDGEELELRSLYKKIFIDRVNYIDDVNSKEYYRKVIEVDNLSLKLYRISNTFKVLQSLNIENDLFNDFVEDLEKEGFKYKGNIKDDLDKYINFIDIRIKGIKTRLNLLKIEYKDVFERKENKQTKFDLTKESVLLQEALPEQKIDERKTTLKRWDAMIQRAKDKATAAKAQQQKYKRHGK